MTASLWQTVLVFFFTRFESLDAFFVFAPIYGFGYAGVMTGVLITARELTPADRRASLMGVILAFGWLGHGLGGFQGGILYDATGGYVVPYANAALAGAINLLLMGTMLWKIRRPPAIATAAWRSCRHAGTPVRPFPPQRRGSRSEPGRADRGRCN